MISSMAGIYPHTATTVSVPEQIRFVSLKIIFSKSRLLAIFGMGSKKVKKVEELTPGKKKI